ncbi:unnamed protein product [Pylaiella littoralis]
MLIPEQGTLEKVLLADVEVLTFTRGHLTNSRRVGAIPQLVCESRGGTAGCPNDPRWLFQTALCRNRGVGDDSQPRWECSASLPADAALGRVAVSCEGYDSAKDPYVLVGSCSLSYSLDVVGPGFSGGDMSGFNLGHLIFLVIFGSFAFRIIRAWKQPSRPPPPAYTDAPPPNNSSSSSSSNPLVNDSACVVMGEPVLATAVPLDQLEQEHGHDIENNNSNNNNNNVGSSPSSSAKGKKGSGGDNTNAGGGGGGGGGFHGGVSVGPPEFPTAGGAIGVPMAEAVQIGAQVGGEGAGRGMAERVGGVEAGQFPPQHIDDLALPQGWEVRVHPATGEQYFVNHRTRSTTWNDPREAEWRRYQQECFGLDQQDDRFPSRGGGGWHRPRLVRPSAGFARPFGSGGLNGFGLGRGLRVFGGGRLVRPMRPGMGGGFGRVGGGGGGGFRGGGGGGMRTSFGGTANR